MEVIENKKMNSSRKLSPLKHFSHFSDFTIQNDSIKPTGKKQLFKSTSQDELTWRPTLKILSPITHSPKQTRRRPLGPVLSSVEASFRKKPIKEAPFVDPKEYEYHTAIVKNENGGRIHDLYSSDFRVESKMGRKHRVRGLSKKRNWISYASLGDKPYFTPEHSPDFYLMEGLVPGVDYKFPISMRYLKNLPNKYKGVGIYTSLMKTIPQKQA